MRGMPDKTMQSAYTTRPLTADTWGDLAEPVAGCGRGSEPDDGGTGEVLAFGQGQAFLVAVPVGDPCPSHRVLAVAPGGRALRPVGAGRAAQQLDGEGSA